MTNKTFSLSLPTPEDTSELARRFAELLEPGDTLLLEGDIGAGKTHFARGLIQSILQVPEDVPSPTFTLVQQYDTEKGEVWHADLYRLNSPDEVIELGLLDAFEDAICLIEWPDRLAELRPNTALTMSFAMHAKAGHRNLVISWRSARWDEITRGLLA